MGFFRKDVTAEPEAPATALAGSFYSGEKRPIFREGFFYVVNTDADGNELGPDLANPLVFDNDERKFKYALPDDVNHFHQYGHNAVELSPGSED